MFYNERTKEAEAMKKRMPIGVEDFNNLLMTIAK